MYSVMKTCKVLVYAERPEASEGRNSCIFRKKRKSSTDTRCLKIKDDWPQVERRAKVGRTFYSWKVSLVNVVLIELGLTVIFLFIVKEGQNFKFTKARISGWMLYCQPRILPLIDFWSNLLRLELILSIDSLIFSFLFLILTGYLKWAEVCVRLVALGRGIGHGSLQFALVLILSCPGPGHTELVYIVASHMSSLQIAFRHH